jgi:predicted PurR-regulated permease PerM
MPIQWRHPRYRRLFLVAVSLGVLLLGFYIQDIVNPLLLALLVSYILNPVVEFLGRRGLSRQVSVTTLFLTAFLVGIFGASIFGLKVYHNITEIRVVLLGEPVILEADLGKDLEHIGPPIKEDLSPGVLPPPNKEKTPKKLGSKDAVKDSKAGGKKGTSAEMNTAPQRYFRDLNGDGKWQVGLIQQFSLKIRPHLSELSQEDLSRLSEFLQKSADKAADIVLGALDSARGYASSIWNIVNYLILVPVYSFFILLNFSSIRSNFRRHLPRRYRDEIIGVATEIDRSVAAFFRGRLIIALIKGFLTGLGLWFLGIPFGFTIGMTCGLLSFVPALGPLVALVTAFILGVANASSVAMLLTGIIVVLVIAEAIETVCYPVVLGKEVGLHPVALILAFLVFGKLFGLFGVLLAVPIASIVKILFRHFVLPEIQVLAEIDLQPDDHASQAEVDNKGEDVVEGGDKGPGGEGGVDIEPVAGQRDDSTQEGGVNDAGHHADADDHAKLDAVEEGGGEKGEASGDGANE